MTRQVDNPQQSSNPGSLLAKRGFLWTSAIFCVTWGLVAWAEWFLVPILVPNEGGPVPYLNFALQALVLFFGCVFVLFFMLVQVVQTYQWKWLLFAIPAGAFVLFQVINFLSTF